MGTSLDVTEYLDPELPGSEGTEWVGRAGGDTSTGRASHARAKRQPRMTFEDPRECDVTRTRLKAYVIASRPQSAIAHRSETVGRSVSA
jgi:hypothetical protein